MHPIYFITTFLLFKLDAIYSYSRFPARICRSSFPINAYTSRSFIPKPKSPVSSIDGRSIKDGSLIEYVSSKGSKRLAMVKKRKGSTLEVLNNVMVEFSVSVAKVTYLIDGTFSFDDLIQLNDKIGGLQVHEVENLWESTLANPDLVVDLEYISQKVFGSKSPVDLFLSINLMNQYGGVFFAILPSMDKNKIVYFPLSSNIVANNLAHRRALEQFKTEFTKIITTQSPKNSENTSNMPMHGPVLTVLDEYADGLKQIIGKGHPWFAKGWCQTKFDGQAAIKAKGLLEFLGLSPSSKSARRVLDLAGIWSKHQNVEKYIMGIRETFPEKVVEEARYLLENHESIPDPDASMRRDLSHLACYSVDREGAAEVDDAVSIERLEDGREILWIHISDVSRWIQPGSALCLEAEKRMTSVYMPDEVISMFPAELSQKLLSLGAKECSFAFSCGVVLDDSGKVSSFEVCPSIVKMTNQLTYIQLDNILNGENLENLVLFESLKKDIMKLNYWAKLRSTCRKNENGAVDDYLQHKSELLLSVNTGICDNQVNSIISTELTYCNSSSYSFVSEFMILMSENVGILSSDLNAAVRYKIQSPSVPLSPMDLELQRDENTFLRSNRIVRSLRAATDSSEPGHHITSGASTYVQCTSPIRRYHDLVNHFYIKAALRKQPPSSSSSSSSSSTFPTFPSPLVSSIAPTIIKSKRKNDLDNAIRLLESRISLLEGNISNEEKIQTLNAVRMVQKSRGQYWLLLYVKQIAELEPKMEFDCMIMGSNVEKDQEEEKEKGKGKDEGSSPFLSRERSLQDVMVFQLGTFKTYSLYVPVEIKTKKGDMIKCNILKIDDKAQLADYIFVPSGLNLKSIPKDILNINNDDDNNI